ncbi:hypothetical protein C0J45_21163 [Silurus meridionalis]|nr:hypothetical protein C0J45_21163 [Silurus meridionalis]
MVIMVDESERFLSRSPALSLSDDVLVLPHVQVMMGIVIQLRLSSFHLVLFFTSLCLLVSFRSSRLLARLNHGFKVEVENELEVVWEAAARENHHLQDIVIGKLDVSSSPRDSHPSPAWKPQETPNQAWRQSSAVSPTFIIFPEQRIDSQQHHRMLSDENQRNGLDFYS